MEWNELARNVLAAYDVPEQMRMDIEVIAQHNAITERSPIVRRWHVDNAYASVVVGGMRIRDLHFSR
jgi:hypothetical protein